MAWKTSTPVDPRLQFIAAVGSDHGAFVSELCRRFGISRKTGYTWLARHNACGPAQLEDQRSSPRRSPPPRRRAEALRREHHPRVGRGSPRGVAQPSHHARHAAALRRVRRRRRDAHVARGAAVVDVHGELHVAARGLHAAVKVAHARAHALVDP
ncbi:MAG: helix-turn-helix domain-containing protein [Polyangiales bacterium]